MEKYYLKNGKEVHIGDIITKTSKIDDPFFGEFKSTYSILITESMLPKLIEDGVIVTKKIKEKKENTQVVPENYKIVEKQGYYLNKILCKLSERIQKSNMDLNLINLDILYQLYPSAVFSMVLKEIAIELDKKYKDHISNSPEIYVISSFNGKIQKANKASIKNYKNFAAFRTLEDARIACKITREMLKDMFGNDK